jgi:Phage XkdN-like tail assembly chaperone protein, TAC
MSDALHALLSYDKEPEKDVYIKRLGVNFRVKAIDTNEFYQIREQATYTVGKGANKKTEVREDEVAALIVAKGVVDPDFSDKKVLEKFKATDAADAVKKALYIGEITLLQDEILRLSGFDDGEEVEEIKN